MRDDDNRPKVVVTFVLDGWYRNDLGNLAAVVAAHLKKVEGQISADGGVSLTLQKIEVNR